MTADEVALDDYVLATDQIAGAENQSVMLSPMPIAAWIMPHRRPVASTIGGDVCPVEVIAFHRDARAGRQVAAVAFILSDGVQSLRVTVDTPTISGRAGDRNPVPCYRLPATDISAFANGCLTVNAEVFPHVGDARSIRRSSESSEARGFSPRYFLKDSVATLTPPIAYVRVAGSDASGVVSRDPALASAAPFATILAALNAIHSQFGATSGIDGAKIRIGAGQFVFAPPAATRNQRLAWLTITREPAVARADAIVTFGSGNLRLRFGGTLIAPVTTGCVRFHDCTVQRTANGAFQGETTSALEVVWDDVTFDNGGINAIWLFRAHDHVFGMRLLNPAPAATGAGNTSGEHRIWRGVMSESAPAPVNLEGFCVIGSVLRRTGSFDTTGRVFSGAIVAFNRLLGIESSARPIDWIGTDIDGAAIVQNVFEYVSTTSAPSVGITSDSATVNVRHIIDHHNSYAGFDTLGRHNVFYDEGAVPRVSTMISVRNSILVSLNMKGDVFRGGVEQGADAATRLGNWGPRHGAGIGDLWVQFAAADGSVAGPGASFAPDYAGLGTLQGTSRAVALDPQFVAPACVTAGPVAGAGGGDYRLAPGSPCRGRARSALLSHDLAGQPRPPANDSPGAYI